jgi:hypothetical protein
MVRIDKKVSEVVKTDKKTGAAVGDLMPPREM